MSLLITQSLIGSIDWFLTCPPSWKEKAQQDLINMLSRKWTKPGPAIQRGIDFENKVYDLLKKDDLDIDNLNCSEHFKKVLKICKGGTFQSKNKSYVTVDGKEYCLYGKEDVTFKDKIIDIKTTYKFKVDKYMSSFQHRMYLYNTCKEKFDYLIVVFKNDIGNEIDRIEQIKIRVIEDDLMLFKGQIIQKIREINQFFETRPTLKQLFETTYSKY